MLVLITTVIGSCISAGFRLVPKSVTLNGIMDVILHFSPNSVALGADYVTVVEDRPIESVTEM